MRRELRSTISGTGWRLHVIQGIEQFPERSRRRDPKWKTTDSNGHRHKAKVTKKGNVKYPTLQWVTVPCSMGHGDDCTSEGYCVCRECREVIHPATTYDEQWTTIPLPIDYELDFDFPIGGMWCKAKGMRLDPEVGLRICTEPEAAERDLIVATITLPIETQANNDRSFSTSMLPFCEFELTTG